MKKPVFFPTHRCYPVLWSLVLLFSFTSEMTIAQSCPASGVGTNITYPNTFYPGNTGTVAAGSKTISLGTAGYGSTPIHSGDIVLIIQMQGAQIDTANTTVYGSGTGIGSGYLNNAQFLAGTMEFAVATSNVALTGGSLTVKTGLVHSYQSSAYGTDGQYTFQVLRVPLYYDVKMATTIKAPSWNGSTGGVMVITASDDINLNGQIIDASGTGFRGGGGRSLSGASSGAYTDFVTLSGAGANGSKGEGIAGTPMYVNGLDSHGNQALVTNATEGYPNGSYAKGAPGNAGGGGSDGDPTSNDQNTGGGGGGNGGWGGNGGDAWSSGLAGGGLPGSIFTQASSTRLVMGGGGGAGTSNNGTGTPNKGLASSGSAGGGIIILISMNTISGNSTVRANGASGNTTVQNDGAGGGGAGGSILIWAASYSTTNITAEAIGGTGGSNEITGGPSHGPGGGGGGGVIFSNSPLNAASSVAGGAAGTTAGTTTSFAATAGTAGVLSTNVSPTAYPAYPILCTVLSASFTDVTARPGTNVVNIGWTMANESTTLGYIVERSTDGANFSAIGNVPYNQAGGVNNEYNYVDASGYALGGTLYYRIRENETGGQFIYSKIVSVRLGVPSAFSGGDLSVFPNPAKGAVNVSFTMTTSEYVNLSLFNLNGSRLWEQQFQASAGQNNLRVDRIAGLPDGIYLLQWFDGLNPRMAKIFVQH